MAKEYLDRLQSLLAPILRGRPSDARVEIKHFFSGAAGYADGKICITLTPVGLAMKLPEDDRARLMARGAKPLRYFPGAPIKKQYVLFPDGVLDDGENLARWARTSIAYVASLPPPKKRKSRPRR